jgi:oligoribonuclease (3'-5' exoribonuclease)
MKNYLTGELMKAQTISVGQTFLPSKLVMLDLEMSGLNPKFDSILQVAALKLDLKGNRYVSHDLPFNNYLHFEGKPESDFAKTHMLEVYRQCNESDLGLEEVKENFEQWLGQDRGKLSPCGDCVPTDVLFMYTKGLIELAHYIGDTPVEGTFHYEYFDMNALKLVARTKVGREFDKDATFVATLKTGAHDALVDCLNQLEELNLIVGQLLSKPTVI